MCKSSPFLRANDLSHTRHWWGLSVLWVRMWLAKRSLRGKAMPQMSQTYGVSPVCSWRWLMRLAVAVNSLLHMSHLWGWLFRFLPLLLFDLVRTGDDFLFRLDVWDSKDFLTNSASKSLSLIGSTSSFRTILDRFGSPGNIIKIPHLTINNLLACS